MADNHVEAYKLVRPQYESFTERLKDLLIFLLREAKIDFHLIEARTKTVKSFEEKITRKKEEYSDPLKEVTDLSGTRIILYYVDDIDKIDEIIRTNFFIDEKNTLDKSKVLKDDQFGYQSYHYIISLNNDRNNLVEWRSYSAYNAELQVRTVLQHAWASISHELQYKRENEIPSTLRRRLFRLASLIELADEEFKSVKDNDITIRKAIANKEEIDNIKVYEELNLATLQQYFSEPNSTIIKLNTASIQAGFEIDKNRKWSNKYIDKILKYSDNIGLKDISNFDSFLAAKLDVAEKLLQNIYIRREVIRTWTTYSDFTAILILLHFVSDEMLRDNGGEGWNEEMWEKTYEAIINNKKTILNNH